MHPISKVNGAGPVTAAMLVEMGITTAEQLLQQPLDKIAALPRVGEVRARKMMDEAQKLIAGPGLSPHAGSGAKAATADKTSASKKNKKKSKKSKASKADKKEPKGKKSKKNKAKTSSAKKKSDKKRKAGKAKSKSKK